jgi:hypothetical protein
VDVGAALLTRARAIGASSLAVVGTSKNAGKSVAIAALADALAREGTAFGLATIGRDGEALDALEATSKPRFLLRPGATVATATGLVPRTPALEILSVTNERSALGAIVLARVRAPGFVEIAGPPTASALRRVVAALAARAPFVLVDGAVDRIAALRDGGDAIVVAVGAAGAPTFSHAVDDAAALVARLRLPVVGDARDAVRIDGALTASIAVAHARSGDPRPLVVADPTHVAFGGRTFLELARLLDIRCERSLAPVACTVAPMGPERQFEPRAFARAVAARTGLPTYDVYAGTVAEPDAA